VFQTWNILVEPLPAKISNNPPRFTLRNNPNRKPWLGVGLFLGLAWLAPAGAHAATVANPRCEYLLNPEGIDATAPRLSWEMVSNERGARQTAWRVLVASSPGELAKDHGDFWDSGKIASDRDSQIYYAGRALESRVDCYWKVRIWDQAGKPSPWSAPARWSMGLLKSGDWKAVWIGCDQPDIAKRHLVINEATYRVNGSAEDHDVTALIANLVKDGSLAIKAGGPFVGATPGAKITLHLDCNFNGEHLVRDVPNGARLTLQQPPAEPRYLRKPFAVAKPVRRARLYVTALGLYQMRLNGAPVGDHILAPEWTDYFKRVQYQTYDVTSALRRGDNVLGAILGNGWYSGNWQLWKPMLRPIYGTQPWLKAQMEIDYMDGSTDLIASDASWRGTTDGPIRLSGIYEGETYDARKEMPGWDSAGFDDHGWENATVGEPKAGQLVAQRSEPIRVTQEIPGARLTEPKPGVYVIDFGQNVAGWCRMTLREKSGTTVRIELNEVLNPDGTIYMDNLHAGHLSEGDRQVVRYTCRGGGETYEPLFTYFGFRYIEVSGLTYKPVPGDFTARVFHTSMREVGTFQCSSALVNASGPSGRT
jgi:alpha-L-rhamnosidase